MHPLISDRLAAVGLDEYLALRDQLLDVLHDEDLAARLGGTTWPLGALCWQMGEIELAYAESFRTFRMHLEDREPEARTERTVAAIRSWYAELDRDLMTALDGISGGDVDRAIVRTDFDPDSYAPRVLEQLDNYLQALLIFYGKVSVYLRALAVSLPPQWQRDIG